MDAGRGGSSEPLFFSWRRLGLRGKRRVSRRVVVAFFTDRLGRIRPITRSMFGPAKWKYLAQTITIRSVEKAQEAADRLLDMFRSAETRTKQVRIKRATVLAANRISAMLKKGNLTRETRKRLQRIRGIYRRAAEKMKLQ